MNAIGGCQTRSRALIAFQATSQPRKRPWRSAAPAPSQMRPST